MRRFIIVGILAVLGVLAFSIDVKIVSVTPDASIVGNTVDTSDFSIVFDFPTNSMGSISQISFVITNKTDSVLKIIWESSVFVDSAGESHRVMHEGVRYLERDKIIPPSTLAPGTKLSDVIYPTDYVSSVNGNWIENPIVSSKPGQQFSILLAIDNGSQIQNYMVTFQIGGVAVAKARVNERIGLGTILYGQAVYGDNGQIVGYNGLSPLFGYIFRNYFDSVNGMKRGQFNWFLEWGVVGLIIPYLGAGGDWVIPTSETNDFVITVGVMYIVPYLGFSIGF